MLTEEHQDVKVVGIGKEKEVKEVKVDYEYELLSCQQCLALLLL
jgi:hypothetical protein